MKQPKSSKRPRRAPPSKPQKQHESASSLDLIGMDMAPRRRARRNRIAIPAIVVVVLAALVMVGVRNNLTLMRYEAAEAHRLEQSLRDRKLAITVEKRKLRDPRLLAQKAAELGFVHPARVVDLAPVRTGKESPIGLDRQP